MKEKNREIKGRKVDVDSCKKEISNMNSSEIMDMCLCSEDINVVDKYEIIKPIGRGSFGEVYLAKDKRLLETVAIKKLPKSEESRKEMRALKAIEHKGLPRIIDFIEGRDCCYLVMEYMAGITLKAYLKHEKSIPLEKCISYMLELIDIFKALHGLHPALIYRDLKPDNIIINPDGRIALIDFGAAFFRNYDGEDGREAYGTRGYSAPELWKGEVAEKSADIYSMGIIMHEMLSGVCQRDKVLIRRPIREYDSSVPESVEKIILKCMQNDKSQRYQSVEDLCEDLKKVREKGTVCWKHETVFKLKKAVVFLAYVIALIAWVYPVFFVPVGMITSAFMGIGLCCSAIAMLLHRFLIYQDMEVYKRVRTRKDIYLTKKSFLGLYMALGFLIGSVFSFYLSSINSKTAYARESKDILWVEMKDANERKLLLRDDCIYEIEDKLRLEIPKEAILGEAMSVKVVARDSYGVEHESREFKIVNK